MRHLFFGLLIAGLVPITPALAAGARLAVVAPTEGPFALLGKQIAAGAGFQAVTRGSELVLIPETCDAATSTDLSKAIIASGAEVVIGFLCTESLEATLPALAEAGIPAITLGVRSGIIMEDALKKGWPLYRFAPSSTAEAEKIARTILARWTTEPLALIDDGTIYGRELVESIRTILAENGMTPVFSDTYRPAQEQQVGLVRRLAKNGATHVFIGGDRNDVSIIARDARAERIPLALMGGEALLAANQPVPLENGVLAVGLPDLAEAGKTVAEAMRADGIEVEGYVLPAFAAVSMVEQAKDVIGEGTLAAALQKGPFPTVVGEVGFSASHELQANPYRLLEWRDDRFIDIEGGPATE